MSAAPRKYKKHNHVKIAKKYATDIVSGKIGACKWTVLSCKRFLDDLEQIKDKDFDWEFNRDRAERACRFVEFLPHVKGKWSGSLLQLEPWQTFLVCNLFGWENKQTKLRRFRRAFVFLPRKNGKTTIAATLGLLMLTVESEPGAEVYCGATSEDQANEVFRPAKAMSERAEGFKDTYGLEVMKSSIFRESGLSFFKKLIGKPGEGQSPYCAIHDEYHEHTTSDQVDSMDTGMGARQEPLQLIITTAGTDISSPCKEFDDYTRQILEGVLRDDRLFALHYTIDEKDDWDDFENWTKANPNYGVSISEDYLSGKLEETRQRVGQQNINRTKHLNEWMNVGTAWMNMLAWRKCEDRNLRLDDFLGEPCWVGIDLASKIDITARMLLFRRSNMWYVFGRYYLPSDTIWLPENKHYQRWVKEGWVTETEGARTDFRILEEDLKVDCEKHPIKELAFDPREASYLIQNIEEWAYRKFQCIEIVQGPAHISEPMKELEAIIYDGKLRTNGDPVLTWMMSNVIKKQSHGQVKYYYPTKERDNQKIDGVVALIMALSRAIKDTAMGSSYNLKANEIEQLRKELSWLHDLPRGDEQEELRLQAHMDEISKRIDKIEGSFITAV
jgi:phage terminase large subunit-like protein